MTSQSIWPWVTDADGDICICIGTEKVTSKKVCLKVYPTFRILESGVATTTINSEDVDADPTIPGIYPNMASKKMRAALGAFYHKRMEKIDQSDATTAGEARSTTGLDEEEMEDGHHGRPIPPSLKETRSGRSYATAPQASQGEHGTGDTSRI
jgi:hypothetical protein